MKKKIIIYIILFLIVVSITVFMIFNLKSDTYKIAKQISNELKSEYDNITIVNGEKEDLKFSYDKVIFIYVDNIGTQESGRFAVAVFKYNSNLEAVKNEEFINSFNKQAHKKLDNSVVELEEYYNRIFLNNTILIKGKYLFSIDSRVKNTSQLLKFIDNMMAKYDVSDKGIVNENELNEYFQDELNEKLSQVDLVYNNIVDNYKNSINKYLDYLEGCTGNNCTVLINNVLKYEKYDELKDEVCSVKKKYNEIIHSKQEIVNSINASIEQVKNNLNEEQYDLVKKKITELNDAYYDEYKSNWNSQLSSIEEKIYKKNSAKYSYKDLLRNPKEYINKKAYFFGQVIQKVSSTQYRIGIDCTKFKYYDGYSCDNTIYVNYYGNINLIEDDIIEMWGNMNGTETYITILGSSVTIPKFTAKYISIK